MNTGDLVDRFCMLFSGNPHAVGTEEGGCQRLPGSRTVWTAAIQAHLTHGPPFGVYPMEERHGVWVVQWGCIDFDEGEQASWIHAQNVRLVARELGMTAWVERSRSKGYHVWFFLQHAMPAVLVRRALLAICQIAQAPTREINPKQTSLKEGQLGNYVRLPYPSALSTLGADPERRTMVNDQGWPYGFGEFVETALDTTISQQDLEDAAELYQEPPKPKPPQRAVTPLRYNSSRPPAARMTGLAFTIWRDGPKDGAPRHRTLYALAAALAEGQQHDWPEALELLQDADKRWGKFTAEGRPEYLEEILAKVWVG